MSNDLCLRKVTELQKEFLSRLSRHKPPEQHFVPSLLTKIVEADDDLLDFTLGAIGQKLRLFAEHVDFQHPEITLIFDGLIADDQVFAQECIELLELGKFARENSFSRIVPYLGRVITEESLSRAIIRKIDTPKNNRMHVRLLANPIERQEIRMTKRVQTIDLQGVYKKGEEIWNVQPDSFKKFLRFDTAYEDDIKIAEKKAKRYEELGCSSLASEVLRSIDVFRQHMEQAYYGFNRITMTTAALILAKSSCYNFWPASDITHSTYGTFRKEATILVPRAHFGKYNFDPEANITFQCHLSHLIGSPIFTQKQQVDYVYEPRVYPLHELNDIASDGIKETIKILESFPDAGNKPIFDHFGVLVPGIQFPFFKDNLYSFIDENGIVNSYKNKDEASKALDRMLVKNGHLHPIIVGERDGKCYFICYFS